MRFFKKVAGVLTTVAILSMGSMQVFAVTLTAEQAKDIALTYVPEGSIHFNTKQDYNKFEIKLYHQKDQTFYEIDVNKTTQKITSFESESQNNFGSTKVTLTEQNAKDIVLKEIDFESKIKTADIVVTGEGKLDKQTVMGKAPIGVATLAKKYHKPVIAFAGSVTSESRICNQYGIDAYFSILHTVTTLEQAMQKELARQNIIETSEQVFRLYTLK